MDTEKEPGVIKKIKEKGSNALCSIKERVEGLFTEYKSSWKKIAAGVMVLFVFSASAGIYKSVQGYRVFFNGQDLGMVRYTNQFMDGLDLVHESLSEEYNADIVFPSEVTFERAIIDKEALLATPEEAAAAIESTNMNLSVEGAVIVIDDEEVVVLASHEEAEKVFDAVVTSYAQLGENEVIVSDPIITEDYKIVDRLVPYTDIRSVEDAAKYIIQGTDEILEYKVKAGDTSWDIAINRGISYNELAEANRGTDMELLHAGDVLKLTEVKPYLHVEVVKEVVRTEKIPFGTTYQNDSSIYVGQTKEISAGVYGLMEVTALVTTVNGQVTNEEVTNEVQVKESVKRVVARGTKPVPPAQGTGRFRMPASGRVSAINKAGSHAGSRAVDIANSTGTAIYASDSGRVIRASWYSGYGYAIIIDHGSGYSTLYGHLSSFNVSVGQNVTAGQRIGSMGNTGNSTGPHLHFEIRRYGTRQVITNYFSYLRVGGYVTANR